MPSRSRVEDLANSGSSSPRAGSELDVTDEHQRSNDAQLAQSLANAAMRARSNTLLDRDRERDRDRDREREREREAETLITPQRQNSGGRSSPTREPALSSTARRRRSSIGAPNPMDHLGDELVIQERLDQQQMYGDRPPGSRFTPQSLQMRPGIAAAARFYRQQRNMSDSSIDSQGGAFIDHRRQQHSLSSFSQSRSARTPLDYRSRMRTVGSDDEHGEPDIMDDFDTFPSGRDRSPSPLDRRGDNEPNESAISSATTRPRVTSADVPEHAIDTGDGPQSPRTRLRRQASGRSYESEHSRHSAHYSNEQSRAGSFHAAEGDVCFPANGAATENDMLNIDLGLGAMYEHEHDDIGVPGILHNFPFPFDFSALEDFASTEREAIPVGKPRNGTVPMVDDSGISSSASPPGYGTSMRSRFGMGGPDGPRRNRRRLSESVGPGRFQKNLALFEGTGDDLPPPQQASYRTILDTKTPLLSDGKYVSNGGAGYGTGGRTGPASGGAKPYRFSFYSNALPTTIHTRTLAEIPAEGQSFEDLFVGRRSTPTADYAESVPGAFGGSTGTHGGNTPVPPANGSRPTSGVPPMNGVSGLGASKGSTKPKGSHMRTDVDVEANTWWLDILSPTDAEMKVLSKVFGIHPLTTEDIQMEETREKIELFRNYYFVCFRSFEQDPYSPTYLEPLNMYIIVFREGTLSFHFRGTPHPQNVRRRIKQLKDYINVTADWISYALIDDITDAFGPLIQNIEYEVDSIDELVLILKEAEQSDMLRRIGMCRKKVMGLLRLMGNKADVVKGLAKRCNENWSVAPKSDIGLYLSDIQDHIMTSTQNLMHYEKILSRSHSNYLAQISIEMTDANNEINNVLSKLTALGTILIPMNLVTGLWGMNVHVPGQDVGNLHWFFGIIGCLGAIALGGAWFTYRVFVRQ